MEQFPFNNLHCKGELHIDVMAFTQLREYKFTERIQKGRSMWNLHLKLGAVFTE